MVNDREIVREAGARVPGSVMKTWRKARRDHPHLFADQAVRVWAQPSAVVDSVIFRWQLELEKPESQQAVNLVDMFTGA